MRFRVALLAVAFALVALLALPCQAHPVGYLTYFSTDTPVAIASGYTTSTITVSTHPTTYVSKLIIHVSFAPGNIDGAWMSLSTVQGGVQYIVYICVSVIGDKATGVYGIADVDNSWYSGTSPYCTTTTAPPGGVYLYGAYPFCGSGDLAHDMAGLATNADWTLTIYDENGSGLLRGWDIWLSYVEGTPREGEGEGEGEEGEGEGEGEGEVVVDPVDVAEVHMVGSSRYTAEWTFTTNAGGAAECITKSALWSIPFGVDSEDTRLSATMVNYEPSPYTPPDNTFTVTVSPVYYWPDPQGGRVLCEYLAGYATSITLTGPAEGMGGIWPNAPLYGTQYRIRVDNALHLGGPASGRIRLSGAGF